MAWRVLVLPTAMPLCEGQLLEGKYRVARQIAAGGMADIHLAVNERLGKVVAVKVLQAHAAQDDMAVHRFEREAQVGARIRSAHVADVFDFGELPSGERFMVMEYLTGESLGTRLERRRTLASHALARITLQILDALVAAHAAGIVHRDLKPDNVFLTTRDREDFAKVLDFGISKQKGPKIRQTEVGVLVGTPLYMSPEQARGQEVDARTDIYSLGVIMYEAAAGAPPFDHESVIELLFQITRDDPKPLEERLPDVDPLLARIVRTAMAKDRNDRYDSAEAMREAVLEWQATLPPRHPSRPSLKPALAPGERLPTDTAATAVFEMPTECRRRRPARAWLAAPFLIAAVIGTASRATWSSTWSSWTERAGLAAPPLDASADRVVVDRVFAPPAAPRFVLPPEAPPVVDERSVAARAPKPAARRAHVKDHEEEQPSAYLDVEAGAAAVATPVSAADE